MASNLVIVAIPAAEDAVWNVSSQKVPHMTILFLGDALANPNVTKITDSVKQAAESLSPFSIRVDHRGVLGTDEADVLFFATDIPWRVHDFRQILLGDVNIRSAYNSLPQHTEWSPHLTLGYPDSPANSDSWDPNEPHYVQFDKVAVWFGDFEGTEIPLFESSKSQGDIPIPAMAWSERVGSILSHHGVKGMRWGVRRARSSISSKNAEARKPRSVQVTTTVGPGGKTKIKTTGGHNQPAHPEAVTARVTGQKVRKSGVNTLSNQELQTYANRLDLEQRVTRLEKANPEGKSFVNKILANKKNQQLAVEQIQKQGPKLVAKAIAKKAAKTAAVAAA